MKDYIKNQRPKNCYMSSESDLQLVQWLLADAGGIAYFGYSYYTVFASQLTVVRVASDRNLGVADTADAKAGHGRAVAGMGAPARICRKHLVLYRQFITSE